MKSLTDTHSLSNGVKIPCLGYGTWKTPNDIAESSTLTALQTGYRHIDTAAVYGNEEGVGKAIAASGLPRTEIFLTSKLWNRDQGYENTLQAFNNSLKKLHTDYLDLYLIHWPIVTGHEADWQTLIKETWRAFEKLYEEKKVRAIGVCNCMRKHLQVLLEDCQIAPMVDQIELHPGLNHADVVDFAQTKNILIEGWSPLGHGEILAMPELASLSNKYGKSVAQICLRWAIQKNILPLPKSTNAKRIKENTEIFDFQLGNEDMKMINELPQMTNTLGADPDKSIH